MFCIYLREKKEKEEEDLRKEREVRESLRGVASDQAVAEKV